MVWILGFLGAIFGLAAGISSREMLGLFGGGLIGVLFGIIIRQRDRVDQLEQRLASAQAPAPTPHSMREVPAPRAAGEFPPATNAAAAVQSAAMDVPAARASEYIKPAVADAANASVTPQAAVYTAHEPQARIGSAWISERVDQSLHGGHAEPVAPAQADSGARFWRWFGEGNWVAKIGIGLLFVGVGALFRYGYRQGWLAFPIEYRFIAVALVGLAALALGFKQRDQRPLFARNLQGGAIGILMLTVFSAYRMYHLLPSSITFGMLLVLVLSCSMLAILQDSLGLAVFGIIGGFAAPILASTGSGNHVALFSYYAILNSAIIAISWTKGWRVLNLLGFLFTFLIGTAWGVLRYRPDQLASTEPFLILFFVMYLLIPLLPALRHPDPKARDRVDGSLVFGVPLIGFGLQAGLLHDDRYALAWSALVLALIYALLARWVWTQVGLARWRRAYAGLSLVFATLAVPLALSAQWTSAVWAVEGALLVWLGLEQSERRLRWMGLLMQGCAGVALVIATGVHWQQVEHHAFTFGAILITLSALFTAIQYQRHGAASALPALLALWAFAWWTLAGFLEIDRHAGPNREADASLWFIALSAALSAWLRRLLAFAPFACPAHAGLLLALPMLVLMTVAHGTPLAQDGWQAWLGYALASLLTLKLLDAGDTPGLGWTHALWWLAIPLLAWIEIRELLNQSLQLGDGWRYAALALPTLLPLAGLHWRQSWLALPRPQAIASLRTRLLPLFAIGALLLAIIASFLSGTANPLLWIPIVNPLELTQIAALLLLAAHFDSTTKRASNAQFLRNLLLGLGFLALSSATLRATHHLGGEPWNANMLAHALPQSALSIMWTVLGILTMLTGAGRRRRALWIVGACLLGLVLGKLVLIDMRFLGDLWGIVSLLGVGTLFVAVGFFAPMPPRAEADEPAR